MAKRLEGKILHGIWDEEAQELTISGMKSVATRSVWDGEQVKEMSDQVRKAIETRDESMVVTLRDAVPMVLDQNEIISLSEDIEQILESMGRQE